MAYRTRQNIFNTAWRGLKAQGFEKSVHGREPEDGTPVCMYRGVGGRRCAIGHCIPDASYNKRAMEGKSAVNDAILAAARINYRDAGFARELQSRHDAAVDAADMELRLRRFAAEYTLTIPA